MDRPIIIKEEDIGFWKNLLLIATFFVVTPLTLGISLFSLFSLRSNNLKQNQVAHVTTYTNSGVRVFASLPSVFPTVTGAVGQADARSQIVKQYLESYNSPLSPYSDFIVATSDKYSLDFRLIAAIAQQESNLCKIIPPDTYNCWGWGIHKNGTLGFSSYDEGIEEVSKGLRQEYLNKGYGTVEEIMSKYTPSSNGSWAFGVNQFMSAMQ